MIGRKRREKKRSTEQGEIWEKSLRENILLKPSENLTIYTRDLEILAIPLSACMGA